MDSKGMNIALFIVLGVALVAIVVLVVIILRSNKVKEVTPSKESYESFGALKAKMDEMDKSLEKTITLTVKEQMAALQKEYAENTTISAQNLNKFQSNITESLQKRMEALNKQMDDKIAQLDKKVDDKLAEGFKNTNESMTQVRERLKTIDEAQKQMEGLGKEMISIKNVLEGNQTRGQYGEYQLDMVLNSVFGDAPNCYELQYTMKKVKDGENVRADAIVYMPEPNKMIAIDSKFPFANYALLFETEDKDEKERIKSEFAADVKKHITAIKDKYIVPNKTAPEAFMFIPNDGVFAFIHHDLPSVVEYARSQRVIITSPSTLPAMLVTINMIKLDAERAKNVQIISKQLNKLGKEFERFGSEWTQLNDRLDKVVKTKDDLNKRVDKISNNFDSISSTEIKEIDVEEDQIQRITIDD